MPATSSRPATCASASSRSPRRRPRARALGRARSSTGSRRGDLDGHALGNLMLVGLTESLGDFCAALDEAGRLVGAVGRVLPATTEPVVLKADVDGEPVEGQVAVSSTPPSGSAASSSSPDDAPACPDALRRDRPGRPGRARARLALHEPAPGDLRRRDPGRAARKPRAASSRSRTCGAEIPETEGLDATDQLVAVLEHGARVDRFLYESDDPGALRADGSRVLAMGVKPVGAHVPHRSGTGPRSRGTGESAFGSAVVAVRGGHLPKRRSHDDTGWHQRLRPHRSVVLPGAARPRRQRRMSSSSRSTTPSATATRWRSC